MSCIVCVYLQGNSYSDRYDDPSAAWVVVCAILMFFMVSVRPHYSPLHVNTMSLVHKYHFISHLLLANHSTMAATFYLTRLAVIASNEKLGGRDTTAMA